MAKKALAAALSLTAFLTKLGIELTADQKTQVDNHEKLLVSAEDYEALETELGGIKEQLTTANETIKGFGDLKPEDVKTKLSDWETKYNTDTKALQDKLTAQAYEHACETYLGGQKFASPRVQKSVLEDFKAQGFKLGEDGKLLGADDWIKALKETEPTAFASEQTQQPSDNIFMDKTKTVNPANQTLEGQVFEAFGLPTTSTTPTN